MWIDAAGSKACQSTSGKRPATFWSGGFRIRACLHQSPLWADMEERVVGIPGWMTLTLVWNPTLLHEISVLGHGAGPKRKISSCGPEIYPKPGHALFRPSEHLRNTIRSQATVA